MDSITEVKTDKPKTSPKGIDHQRTIALHKQGLSKSDIARIQGCVPSNITRTLARYGVEDNILQRFKENRGDVFAGLQERIIRSIKDEEIEKASLQVKMMSLGILFDKEMVLSGKSTGGVNVLIQHINQVKGVNNDE